MQTDRHLKNMVVLHRTVVGQENEGNFKGSRKNNWLKYWDWRER